MSPTISGVRNMILYVYKIPILQSNKKTTSKPNGDTKYSSAHTLVNQEVKSRCKVNNTVSDWFMLERDCRQGDPISPYLFLIASEILASMIRQNGHIKGYTINGIEIKVSQYADDTTIFLDGSEQLVTRHAKTTGAVSVPTNVCVLWDTPGPQTAGPDAGHLVLMVASVRDTTNASAPLAGPADLAENVSTTGKLMHNLFHIMT
ncbi:reverse transcriptase [Plakobranchus ocellatus]|uniref:Reverse transcriptase n=1 Tax=Plakobranchus ocellatus TaxID=259542 RepID=A0AAV3ZCS2_9GAST|nr:reverse transcriptase [Plakobranchus ocellatus]